MFIVNSYGLAVVLCIITMICWGSWGNTQKLAAKNWRYELFYWDYTVGILLFSLLLCFTLGSIGDEGRSFIPDLMQVDGNRALSALAVGDFDAAHPLRVGYENFIPMPYDRPCWDLIPIINLVEHNSRLLHESDNGRIRLDEGCCTRFDIDHSGNCRFVALNTDTLTSFIAGKVKPMKQSENINNK